jgi:Lar family restriction alleviation protein
MTDLRALMPCPFCGNQPILKHGNHQNSDKNWWQVHCNKGAHNVATARCGNEANAIHAWNTRSSAELKEAREVIEFYALGEGWECPPGKGCGAQICVQTDKGNRARLFLQEGK